MIWPIHQSYYADNWLKACLLKALLDSSCSSACSECSDTSDEDEIFSINKYTGEWEGSSQTKQLLRKRRGSFDVYFSDQSFVNLRAIREFCSTWHTEPRKKEFPLVETILEWIGTAALIWINCNEFCQEPRPVPTFITTTDLISEDFYLNNLKYW